MGRESFLDVLRFVAAAAVVVFHFGFRGYSAGVQDISYPELAPIAKYGYLGVNLFFMISGYVIPLSIHNRSVTRFCVSRAIRLYPTFWLCAALTYAALVALGDQRFYISPYDALVNLTMVANWLGSPFIDGVYWTLVVELQFYALVAVSVWVFGFKRLPHVLLAWLLIGAGISVLTKLTGYRLHYLGGNYYMYFCFGAACYFLHNIERSVKLYTMLFLSLVLVLSQGVIKAGNVSVELGSKIDPVIVCAVLICCATAIYFTRQISRSIQYSANLAFLGGLTYPLYLIHENFGYSFLNAFFSQETRWTGFVYVVSINLVIAAMILEFFDKPVRAWLTDLSRRDVNGPGRNALPERGLGDHIHSNSGS